MKHCGCSLEIDDVVMHFFFAILCIQKLLRQSFVSALNLVVNLNPLDLDPLTFSLKTLTGKKDEAVVC